MVLILRSKTSNILHKKKPIKRSGQDVVGILPITVAESSMKWGNFRRSNRDGHITTKI